MKILKKLGIILVSILLTLWFIVHFIDSKVNLFDYLYIFVIMSVVSFLIYKFIRKQFRGYKRLFTLVLFICLTFVGLIIFNNNRPIIPNNYTVTIEATGAKNIAAQGTEVWLLDILADGKSSINNHLVENQWEYKNNTLVSFQNQPAHVVWEGRVFHQLELLFTKHEWSGKVEIDDGIEVRSIDLYSKDSSQEKVSLIIKNSTNYRTYFLLLVDSIFLAIMLFLMGSFIFKKIK